MSLISDFAKSDSRSERQARSPRTQERIFCMAKKKNAQNVKKEEKKQKLGSLTLRLAAT